MTYKEALLFVSKCLTLGVFPERRLEIVEKIKGGEIVWEQIVAVSSRQFVLPALFVRLQYADILNEMPSDLVDYMDYLTQINSERNRRILGQINDINQLMTSHNIDAVFLKGSAHLLHSLYDDIAERMIGDIDFLVPEVDYFRASQLLLDAGYNTTVDLNERVIKNLKHYPRLTNYDYPAAVEVHRQVIAPLYDKYFDASLVLEGKQQVALKQLYYIPSNGHLIIHNTLNAQINDKSFLNATVNMRQMYDLLLLSKLENPQLVLTNYAKLPKLTNAYLAVASIIFNVPNLIGFNNDNNTKLSLLRFTFFINHPGKLYSVYKTSLYFAERISSYVFLPIQAIYKKDVRIGLWHRLSSPKWYLTHIMSYWEYFKPKN